MNLAARSLRSIGWIAVLMVCLALVTVLAFAVNSLRSQVHQSELKIVALKQETMYLETEFETRANQQQLKAWNDVEFGYVAPVAGQYLETERQLAAFAKPAEPDAPAPVRMASNDDAQAAAAMFPAMVSPLTGKREVSATDAGPRAALVPAVALAAGAGLAERLALVQTPRDAAPAKPDKPEARPHAEKAHPAHAKAGAKVAAKSAPAKAHGNKGAPIRLVLDDLHAKPHAARPHPQDAAKPHAQKHHDAKAAAR